MYKHVLLPTDGSELSMKGVERGLALAKELKASATIVTVTPAWSSFDMASEARMGHADPIETFEKEASEAARRILDDAKSKAEAVGLDAKLVHLADMHAAEGIIKAAKEHGSDLIVMSSHGRRGVRQVILGSQTAEVIATINIPVLVIR